MSKRHTKQVHHTAAELGAADRIGRGGGRTRVALSRRAWLRLAGGTIAGGVLAGIVGRRVWAGASTAGHGTPMTVYASPTCGCCHEWISYLGANGFDVETHNVDDVTAIKRERHIPDTLWSCHTGVVGGYLVEGHVPVDLVRKMLSERPTIAGLAVPGMPSSAPGMDGAPAPYTVLAFTADGESSVYAER